MLHVLAKPLCYTCSISIAREWLNRWMIKFIIQISVRFAVRRMHSLCRVLTSARIPEIRFAFYRLLPRPVHPKSKVCAQCKAACSYTFVRKDTVETQQPWADAANKTKKMSEKKKPFIIPVNSTQYISLSVCVCLNNDLAMALWQQDIKQPEQYFYLHAAEYGGAAKDEGKNEIFIINKVTCAFFLLSLRFLIRCASLLLFRVETKYPSTEEKKKISLRAAAVLLIVWCLWIYYIAQGTQCIFVHGPFARKLTSPRTMFAMFAAPHAMLRCGPLKRRRRLVSALIF